MSASVPARLVAEGVSRRHGGVAVVDDVSLASGGTVLAVAGPSGAGKTALLAVLAAVLPASSGRVEVGGRALFPARRREAARARRLVGYVPPPRWLDDGSTVRDHLLLHAAGLGVARRERAPLVDGLLELLDLGGAAGTPLARTSTATGAVVAMARALVADPPVLLLDDPTRALGPDTRDDVLHLVAQLAGLGKAIVLATEPDGPAVKVATHVAELDHGRLVRFTTVPTGADVMGAATVYARDLHRRRDESRLLIAVPIACAVAAVALYGVYRAALDARRGVRGASVLFGVGIGRVTAHVTLFVALVVCCAVLPALGAASVAGERERGTLLPLLLTRQRALSITVGKVLSVWSLAVALVVALLPVLALAQLLGGVPTSELARGVAMVLACALVITASSVAASAVCRRASTATAVAYTIVGLLVLGSLAVFGFQALIGRQTEVYRVNHAVLAVNPFVATADVVAGPTGTQDRLPSPFTPFVALIGDRVTVLDDLEYLPSDAGGFNRRFVVTPFAHGRATPFWRSSALAYGTVVVVSLAVAARRLRLPREDVL